LKIPKNPATSRQVTPLSFPHKATNPAENPVLFWFFLWEWLAKGQL